MRRSISGTRMLCFTDSSYKVWVDSHFLLPTDIGPITSSLFESMATWYVVSLYHISLDYPGQDSDISRDDFCQCQVLVFLSSEIPQLYSKPAAITIQKSTFTLQSRYQYPPKLCKIASWFSSSMSILNILDDGYLIDQNSALSMAAWKNSKYLSVLGPHPTFMRVGMV